MKILIVKTSSLGDIIHAFPTLAYLRNKFPHAQIDWVVEAPFAELIESHPGINHVIRVKTRTWRRALFDKEHWKEVFQFRKQLRKHIYDVVFDLQGNTKSALITFQARSKHKVGYGLKTAFEWPNTFVTHHRYNPPLQRNVREECLYLARQYFKEVHLDPIEEHIHLKISTAQHELIDTLLATITAQRKVLVCPGSAWINKQMTTASLIDFLKLLQPYMQCHFLVLWGSPTEKEVAETIRQQLPNYVSIVDKLPLQVLQNLMSRMDLVISMDSLPLHLAGTTRTASFGIFGPSSAQKYAPTGLQQISMQGSCPYGRIFERRCPILRTCPTGQCMRGLTGQQVFEHFKKSAE